MGELAALGAAAALAAMLFASRLPAGPEFFLPRRGGFFLYTSAWRLFANPRGPALYSALVASLLIVCALLLALSLRRARPGGLPKSWSARAGLLTGPLFAVFLAGRAVSNILDLVQLVWFPYGGLDAREPLAVFALAALAFVPAALAAAAWIGGRRRRASLLLIFLAVLDAGGALLGAAKGVGRPAAARGASGRTLFVVLTEGAKGPDREAYALSPDVFDGPDARPELTALASAPRDARTLPALRALYEEEEKRWDLPGLRDALLLGVSRRDPLAVSLLVAHLSAVAPSPEALAALGVLADEDAWRVGPLGAAELSRAYAHLGDGAAAARWSARAGGPGGVAPGLLAAPESPSPIHGKISGTLRAPGRARVALYLKTDPSAPYLLDAAGLVASAEPDGKGRFSFSGLPAGRYYLALAVSDGDGRRGEVSVSGSRGDLTLDARRPSLDLPPLTLKLTPR